MIPVRQVEKPSAGKGRSKVSSARGESFSKAGSISKDGITEDVNEDGGELDDYQFSDE